MLDKFAGRINIVSLINIMRFTRDAISYREDNDKRDQKSIVR